MSGLDVIRCRPHHSSGAAVQSEPPARDWRPLVRTLVRQLLSFAAIGLVFNVLYLGLYVLLRTELSSTWANVAALVLSTIGDTAANRRLTFGVRNRSTIAQHQVLGLALLVVGLVVTSGSLWLLDAVVASPGRVAEVAVLAAANLLVGVIRFTALRAWMRPDDIPIRLRRTTRPPADEAR